MSVARSKVSAERVSRSRFIGVRLLSMFTIYIFMCLYYDIFPLPDYLNIQPKDFAPSKRTLLRGMNSRADTITSHKIVVRLWCVFEFVAIDWCTLTACHDLFANISVTLHLDGPEDWPSLYENIDEAHTMRNTGLDFGTFLSTAWATSTLVGYQRRYCARRSELNVHDMSTTSLSLFSLAPCILSFGLRSKSVRLEGERR